MKRALALACIASLISAPAFAQQAPSGKTDWSKPVIIDGGIFRSPPAKLIEDAPLPIEVYTRIDLNAPGAAASPPTKAPDSPPEPGCNPDAKAPAGGKSAVLSVCPAMPAAKP